LLKKSVASVTAVALLILYPFCQSALADPDEAAGMPEYSNQFVARTANGIIPLERQTASTGTLINGFSTFKITFWVPGAVSPVHLASGHDTIFYVRVDSQATDPQTVYHLYLLTSAKGRRSGVAGTMNELTGLSPKGATPTPPYIATKKGTNFFEMRPASDLPPGEYGWSRVGDSQVYLFSVGP